MNDPVLLRAADRILQSRPQEDALFPHMTVAENVGYGLRMRGVGRGDAARRVAQVLELVGLVGQAPKLPHQLSGGQQQRVALARALVVEPEVLLLDEPLSNLDAKLRVRVRGEIRQLQERLRKTTVYVTHDQEEALAISDRIAVMHEGRVQQVGTPHDIYFHPANRFVADFVGLANFIDGEVIDERRVQIGGTRLVVSAHRAGPGPVTLVVRPETIRLLPADAPPPRDENVIRGQVTASAFLGGATRYWVRPDQLPVPSDLIVDAPASEDPPLRGAVLMVLPHDRIHPLPGPPEPGSAGGQAMRPRAANLLASPPTNG